jgi:hypothetical protein
MRVLRIGFLMALLPLTAAAQMLGASLISTSAGGVVSATNIYATGVSATQYAGLARAGNFTTIAANVTSANGGTATTACPTGYTILFYGITSDHRTATGTAGWLNGTLDCSISGNGVIMVLSNYSGGTVNTQVTCTGLCVRN